MNLIALVVTGLTLASPQEPASPFWDAFPAVQEEEAPPQEELPPQEEVVVEEGEGSVLVDFDRFEIYPRIFVLVFSSDFEADPAFGAGLSARAPTPWFSRDLLGLEEDSFGVFAEVAVSGIDRDTDPELEDPDGTLFFATLGMDYTFIRDETFMAGAQLGLQYGYFGGVTDLENGVALLLGLTGGLNLGEGFWIGCTPQLAIADEGDFIFHGSVGLVIEF